ncbi:MAG: DNA polymerase I [Armatimonadota bacterium]
MSSKLVLIDGNSLVHRAYHALPPLSNAEGQPTNAVYGFVQMVLPLLEQEQPEQVIVAFDPKGPTFRHELDSTYKGTRVDMDVELAAQMALAREAADALGLGIVEVPGFEADDVIGTLTERAHAEGREVLIVSGDRDLVQLVRPGVTVMATIKGMKDVKLYDEEAVREQYALRPEQIVDMKALAGDTTDNIPGISGIGPVGAAKLLAEYGTVEGIYDHLSEIKQEALRKKLENGRELANLGKILARIERQVPMEVTEEQLAWHGPKRMAARRLFAKLEFGNLLERTGHWGADWEGEIKTADEAALESICTQARAAGHLTLLPLQGPKGQVGLALTASTQEAYLWLLPEKEAAVGGLFSEETAELPECLAQALADETLPKWGSRLKEAAKLLRQHDVHLAGYEFDAEVADYLLAPQRSDHSIMLMAARELGWWVPAADKDLPVDLPGWQVRPAVEAMAIEHLRATALEELEKHQLASVFSDVEMPLEAVLADMEERGIAIDVERLTELGKALTLELAELVGQVHVLAGCEFNLESPKQVGEVLFGQLCLAKGKKTNTGWSTSADVLDELSEEHEVVAKILAYRELSKLKSTYVDSLVREIDARTGRIHTTFEQTVTATGRLSSRAPNLQNIPIKTEAGRQIRSCLIAPAGRVLIKADYSQIELRLLAHFCGDENLVTAFRQAEDIHRRTASMIYGCAPVDVTSDMRRIAKTVNFAVLYGMGANALSKSLGIPRAEAQQFIESYFTALSSVKAFMDGTIAQAKEQGYVTTYLGRRRPMPELNSPDRAVAAYAERAAANTPLQGSAADIVKVAMVRLAKVMAEQFPEAGMLLQVHDELVVEAPEAEAQAVADLMRDVMENVVELRVPLVVDIAAGCNWRDVEGL